MEGRGGPEGVEHLSRREECLCEFERLQEVIVPLPQHEAPENNIKYKHGPEVSACHGRGRVTYVLTWLVNQPTSNGSRREICAEVVGHVVLAGAAGTLSPAP